MKDLLEITGIDPFDHSYKTAPWILNSLSGRRFYTGAFDGLIKWDALDKSAIKVSHKEAELIKVLFG